MIRDLARLSASAARVQQDLDRTTERSWACAVSPELVLSLSGGDVALTVALDPEVEDEEWFAPDGATAEQRAAGLDADADELVAGEVAEALRVHGISWPVCPDHDHVLGSCEGWWYCEGGEHHDVARVGSLPARPAGGSSPPG